MSQFPKLLHLLAAALLVFVRRADLRIRKTMEPMIDHIRITIKDMATAGPFYDKLLPLLGFDLRNKVSAVIEEHECHVVEYTIRG